MSRPAVTSLTVDLELVEDLEVHQVTYTADTSPLGEPYGSISVWPLSIFINLPEQARQLIDALETIEQDLTNALQRAEVQRQRAEASAPAES